jgi:hypothetical protein
MSGMASCGAVPITPQILDAMDRTSDRLFEKLLQDHWTVVREVLENSERANAPTTVFGRRHAELSFGGITCD